MVMAAKLPRLTHKIAIQLHVAAESCAICSYCSRWPVWKLLDIPSHAIISALQQCGNKAVRIKGVDNG